MLTEAYRYMHYSYVYVLTTDVTSIFFLVQKQYFKEKAKYVLNL